MPLELETGNENVRSERDVKGWERGSQSDPFIEWETGVFRSYWSPYFGGCFQPGDPGFFNLAMMGMLPDQVAHGTSLD